MRRQNFDEPGHALELNLCCYRRLPLLEDDNGKRQFLDSLGRARLSQRFDVKAYVVMPEHDGLRMDECDALLQVVGSGASSR